MQANIANPPYTIDSDIEKGASSARVTFKNDAKDSDSLFVAIMYKLALYPSTVVRVLLPVDDFFQQWQSVSRDIWLISLDKASFSAGLEVRSSSIRLIGADLGRGGEICAT